MPRNNRWKRNRRIVLFQKQGGLCFWCKKPMKIFDQPGGWLPAHACTLDHVFPRSDPRRNDEAWSGQRLVAACFLCNNKRGNKPFERTLTMKDSSLLPMHRVILTGVNSRFPRAASVASITNSGTTPDSAPGGTRFSELTATLPPEGAGLATAARRPRATVQQSMGVVWLWDSGEFDTVEIAEAMRIPEAEIASILHHIREDRRARA